MPAERSLPQSSHETDRPEYTVGRGEVKVPVIDEQDPHPLNFFRSFAQLNGQARPESKTPHSFASSYKDRRFSWTYVVIEGNGKPAVTVAGEYRFVGDEEETRLVYDPEYDINMPSRTQGYETYRVTVPPTEKSGPPDEVVAVRKEDRTGLPLKEGKDTTFSVHGVDLATEDPEELKTETVRALQEFKSLIS